MLYAWVPASIHLSLGLLATASGVVLLGLLVLRWQALRLWTLRLWTWLYVGATVACGAARFAFPGETQSPSAWVDVIPLAVLPVTFLTLRLIRLAGLGWGAVYAAFATLFAHLAISSTPFAGLTAGLGMTVPRPGPPELLASICIDVGDVITRSRSTGIVHARATPSCALSQLMPCRQDCAGGGRCKPAQASQNKWLNVQYSPADSAMATGRVSTHPMTMLRIVANCRPEPLAAMVPAMPDDST
jgi:hypothetical protein